MNYLKYEPRCHERMMDLQTVSAAAVYAINHGFPNAFMFAILKE